jgi:hypothetical protein
MFALITPRANRTRNKNADQAAAVLSAKQAAAPLKADRPQVQDKLASPMRQGLAFELLA